MRAIGPFIIMGLFILPLFGAFAQDEESIHISGVVVSADSLQPVSFTTVIIKNTSKGTISDNSGYFSIYADKLDTLVFTNVGFKKTFFVVPKNLPNRKYGLVQVMQKDTVLLGEVEIYAFPREEDFKRAFMEIEVGRNQADRTREMQARLHEDLEEKWRNDRYYYDQMRYSKLYNLSSIAPPNNFLNPITWSNFIRNWREGKYRNTEDHYLPSFREEE